MPLLTENLKNKNHRLFTFYVIWRTICLQVSTTSYFKIMSTTCLFVCLFNGLSVIETYQKMKKVNEIMPFKYEHKQMAESTSILLDTVHVFSLA